MTPSPPTLQPIPDEGDSAASWYAVKGGTTPRVERYVVSTPDTRAICNRPEIVGCEYTGRLRDGLAIALASAPFRAELCGLPQHRLCVLHFLRGGLNFGLREALQAGLGLVRQGAAFLSSQRSRDATGRWVVREDQYRRLTLPPGAIVLVGDVVATGSTVEHALGIVVDHLRREGGGLDRLVFFTIGGRRLEEILDAHHGRLRAVSPDYRGAIVVYLEGRFDVASEESTVPRLGRAGTDLMRAGALLAPEFEASQDASLGPALERCAIYDAGSRAFDVPEYVADVASYWRALRDLAREGVTLADVLAERAPGRHVDLDDGSAAALERLCTERLDALAALGTLTDTPSPVV